MKTLSIITSLILVISVNLHAQLKYEGKVDSRYKTVQLDDGTYKYLKYNKEDKKVLIFNLDNSLWRTISLPLPENHLLDEIKNISVNTFNDDEFVELIYSCVVYSMPDNMEDPEIGYVQIEFTLNIINEEGKLILSVPGSNEMEILESDSVKKLLIYKHVGKHFSNEEETIIYSF
jgi:hypothetical protein